MRRGNAIWVATLLLAATVTTAVLAVSVGDPSSSFGPDEGRSSPFVADAQARGMAVRRVVSTPLAALQDSDSPPQTLLAIFGAPRPFDPSETEAVREFLESGGQVLLVDTFGYANSLASPLGVTFERVRLVDPSNATTSSLDGGQFRVQWRAPTALQVAPDRPMTVLAASTSGSFLDRDGNGTIDVSDLQGSFPVAVELPFGPHGGLLVAVADDGPFHGPAALGVDNAAWRRALLAHLLPAGGTVWVDESRQPLANPLTSLIAATTAAASLPPWNWVLGTLGVGFLLLPLLPRSALEWSAHKFRPDRFIRRSEAG